MKNVLWKLIYVVIVVKENKLSMISIIMLLLIIKNNVPETTVATRKLILFGDEGLNFFKKEVFWKKRSYNCFVFCLFSFEEREGVVGSKTLTVVLEIWNKDKTFLWDVINEEIIPICKLGKLFSYWQAIYNW